MVEILPEALECGPLYGDAFRGDRARIELDGVALAPDDQYILTKLNQTIEEVNAHLARYRFNDATLSLYDFFWHAFCDRYVEYAKPLLYRGRPEEKERTLAIMHTTFSTALRLLHPFMPFLTEELWEGMEYNHTDVRIMRAPWPSSGLAVALEADTVAYVEAKHDLIRVGRILRKEYGLALKQTAPFR